MRGQYGVRILKNGTMLHDSGAVLAGGVFAVVLLHCGDCVRRSYSEEAILFPLSFSIYCDGKTRRETMGF